MHFLFLQNYDVLSCFSHQTLCHQPPSVLTWSGITVPELVGGPDLPALCVLGPLLPAQQPGGKNYMRREAERAYSRRNPSKALPR